MIQVMAPSLRSGWLRPAGRPAVRPPVWPRPDQSAARRGPTHGDRVSGLPV